MAVVAFIFGSILGVFVAFFASIVLTVPILGAFSLYLITTFFTAGLLISAAMKRPPDPTPTKNIVPVPAPSVA